MIQKKVSYPALILLATIAFLFSVSASTFAETKAIAVIDMQKVVRNCKAGKKAMKELNRKFESLKRQLQAKQKELQAFKKDLEKKAPLMSEEARAEKERQYKKMLREFKDKSDDAQYEMRQAEAKRMEPILKKLEKVVNKIGKEKHYLIILEKNMPGLYYVAPGTDITQEVIKAFDSQS
ncbi:MAG: OmpH family outer membrane protein [Thermodesulfobacteria bacterium]|nr:OmpH family outer membrane protein [Thermodesulfobacteriota bacterium]